jgi:hypothetical protein
MSSIVAFDGTTAVAEDLDEFDRALRQQEANLSSGGGDEGHILRMNGRSGVWSYGQDKTEIEEDAIFAVNVGSARWGWRIWDDSKPRDIVVSPTADHPAKPEIPQHLTGVTDRFNNLIDWKAIGGFNLYCLTGEDEGEVFNWVQDSGGAFTAYKGLMAAYMKRPSREHRTPLVRLTSVADGDISYPKIEILGWGDAQRDIVTKNADLKRLLGAETSEAADVVEDDASEADAKDAPKRRRRRSAA